MLSQPVAMESFYSLRMHFAAGPKAAGVVVAASRALEVLEVEVALIRRTPIS